MEEAPDSRVPPFQNSRSGGRGRGQRGWSGPGSGRLVCLVSLTPKPRAVLGLWHVSSVVSRGRPCCLNFTVEDNQESLRACPRPLSGSLCPVLPIPTLLPTPCHRWAGLGQVSSETKEASFSTDLAVTGRRHRMKGNHRKCPDGLSLFSAGGWWGGTWK